jgi:hypothetical protein
MVLVALTETTCPFFLVDELTLELELSVELSIQQSQRLLGPEWWLLLPANR